MSDFDTPKRPMRFGSRLPRALPPRRNPARARSPARAAIPSAIAAAVVLIAAVAVALPRGGDDGTSSGGDGAAFAMAGR